MSIQEEEALKDQDLANALKDTDYVKAVQLAFELKRPFRLLHVFEEVFRLEKPVISRCSAVISLRLRLPLKPCRGQSLEIQSRHNYVESWKS